jgi:hypothetical protein
MSWIFLFEGGRTDVVASPPQLDLRLAELLGRLGFVQPLQGAVMPLVQSPIPVDGNPHQFHLVEQQPQGPYRTLQYGSERDVKRKPVLFQATAGILPLFSAAIGQVNVRPTGKEVFLVPNAFPVSQENHLSEAPFRRVLHEGISRPSSSATLARWRR